MLSAKHEAFVTFFYDSWYDTVWDWTQDLPLMRQSKDEYVYQE